MIKPALIYFLFSVMIFVSCDGAQEGGFTPVQPQDKVMTYPYPAQEVWEAVFRVLAKDDKIDIGETDTENMVISTLAIPIDPDSELGRSVFYKESGEFFVHLGEPLLRALHLSPPGKVCSGSPVVTFEPPLR